MKSLSILLLACLPALAAVDGTVFNRTTGQPQSGATVTLYKFGQGGMEPVAHVQSDPQGKFNFTQQVPAEGPSIVRVELDGVTYNHLMPPGAPTTGITINVYKVSKQQPAEVKISKHMILFQPSAGQMSVEETFLIQNDGKTTWADPASGTLRFFLPPAAKGNVDAKGTAPDGAGMAVPVPTDKTQQGFYAAKFEIKPGETRIDLTYSVPYTEGQQYAGIVASRDENTYLVAPSGVTLTGDKLNDLGLEPKSQAHIYGLQGNLYKVKLTGTVAAAQPAATDDSSDQSDSSGPQIEQIMPRVYTKAPLILGISLGILALGFALLYRAPVPKESNERGHR